MKKYLLSTIAVLGVASTALGEITVVPTTYTTNGMTYIMETLKDFDTKSGGALSKQEDNTFNDKNLIVTTVVKSWDPVWEEFAQKSKVEYEYDADGRLTKKINYNNVSQEITAPAEWAVANYVTYTYGANGKMTLQETTRNSNGEYFVAEHVEYEYDAENHLVKESRSSCWSPTGTLALSSVINYTEYNENGNPESSTTDSYYNNEVTGTKYATYTYDDKGNRTVYATLKKDDKDELVKETETVFTFTDANEVATEIYYKADSYTGQWGPYYRWDFSYDETAGYPVKKEYHVYSIDFMSESIYNTYEYGWKLVQDTSVGVLEADSDLAVRVNGDLVNVSGSGLTSVTIYDMEGHVLRSLTQAPASSAILDASGMNGCFIVIARGEAGSKARKITL